MLRNHARFKVDDGGPSKGLRRAKDGQRERDAVPRRWLPDSSVQGWHGLAAILAMMPVRRTMHGPAALHGLLGRGERIAIQCVPGESQGQEGEKNSSRERHSC